MSGKFYTTNIWLKLLINVDLYKIPNFETGENFPYTKPYDAGQDYNEGVNCFHLVRGSTCSSKISRRFCPHNQTYGVPDNEEFTFRIPYSSWKFVVYYQFFECDGSVKGGFTQSEKVTKPSVFVVSRDVRSTKVKSTTTKTITKGKIPENSKERATTERLGLYFFLFIKS